MSKLRTAFAVLFILTCSLRLASKPRYGCLVFEGGGVRGIAYTGALQVLDSGRLLDDVEVAFGTSVGGLTAALYSVGYSPKDLSQILSGLKIQRFNDGRWAFIGGAARTSRHFGWYRGERFEAWVADLVGKATGKPDLTLGELHALHEKAPQRYKDVYLFATDLTAQRSVAFSYETHPGMPVHLAVRASMSIPLYFGAVFIDSAGVAVRKPRRDGVYSVVVDGGLTANYPIGHYRSGGHDRQALGLKLERPAQIAQGPSAMRGLAPYPVRTFSDYVGALYNIAIETLNAQDAAAEIGRTVYISTEGVGPRVRRMKKADVERLVESGRQGARRFLAATAQSE